MDNARIPKVFLPGSGGAMHLAIDIPHPTTFGPK
jgi:hypothetical protein